METWRPVVGFEGRYEVSDQGRVKTLHNRQGREALMTPNPVSRGHLQIGLTVASGRRVMRYVHVLVAEAFIGPKPKGMETRHLNGDNQDCRAVNLCYGTHSENTLDSVRHGTHNQASKTECKHGHPYTEENTFWRQRPGRNPERDCKTCRREAGLRYVHSKRHANREG